MNGATAATPHAIAAVYISVSLVFGKSMINWADDRFGYYVMKQGPKPYKPVGLAYSKNYAKSWLKHLLSYIIGTGKTVVGGESYGNDNDTENPGSPCRIG